MVWAADASKNLTHDDAMPVGEERGGVLSQTARSNRAPSTFIEVDAGVLAGEALDSPDLLLSRKGAKAQRVKEMAVWLG